MKNPVLSLSQPQFQISVQQFFKGVSWSGHMAPAISEGVSGGDGPIPTFHPTKAAADSDPLNLMQSVRGFMANVPWTGAVVPPMGSQTALGEASNNPPSHGPANLDAFSDFF